MKIPVWSRKFPEGVGNWRRRRFLETGNGYGLERATRPARSSMPVYRDRINPATGRPRRDDAEVYRRRDEAIKRMREQGRFLPQSRRAPEPWQHGPDAYSSTPAPRPPSPHERADRVLGRGTADRAREAHRQAHVNPREQRQNGRSR